MKAPSKVAKFSIKNHSPEKILKGKKEEKGIFLKRNGKEEIKISQELFQKDLLINSFFIALFHAARGNCKTRNTSNQQI
jgi:hypothetical protein